MADTYTSKLRLVTQATGENSGTWGSNLNTGMIALIDDAVAGTATVALTSINVTLTANNGSSDQARNQFIELTGTIEANLNVVIPSVSKGYWVKNSTSGAFAVSIRTVGATGVNLPQGGTTFIYCNGSTTIAAPDAFPGGFATPGNVSVGGTLTVTGATCVAGLTATGNTSVAGTLVVGGATSINGALTIEGAVSVEGTSTFEGAVSTVSDLTVGGNTSVTGTLVVGGAVSINGAATIEGNVSVEGTTTLEGAVSTVAGLTVGTTASIASTLTVSGAVSIGNNLKVEAGAAIITISGTGVDSSPALNISNDAIGWSIAARGNDSDALVTRYNGTNDWDRISTAGAMRWAAYGTGTITSDSSGNLTSVSDLRFKNVLGKFEIGMEALKKIETIRFRWNKESKLNQDDINIGFSAQNIKSVVPEAVGVDANGNLTLLDRPILALLVNAVKELEAKVEALSR